MGPGLLLIAPILAFDVWIIWTLAKEKFSGGADSRKIFPFIALLLIGIGVGIWLAFYLTYKPVNFRLSGFPIPTHISKFDQNQWTDGNLPAPIQILGVLTNFLTGIAVLFLPLKIASTFRKLKQELSK